MTKFITKTCMRCGKKVREETWPGKLHGPHCDMCNAIMIGLYVIAEHERSEKSLIRDLLHENPRGWKEKGGK